MCSLPAMDQHIKGFPEVRVGPAHQGVPWRSELDQHIREFPWKSELDQHIRGSHGGQSWTNTSGGFMKVRVGPAHQGVPMEVRVATLTCTLYTISVSKGNQAISRSSQPKFTHPVFPLHGEVLMQAHTLTQPLKV